MKDVTVSVDGIRLSYEVRGTGAPALVLVHGWSCDRGYWSEQLDHFSRRHRVVALDLAGHGESGTGRRAWTMEAFGLDVVAVVQRLGPERAVLVGHSMGGNVIVEAARRMRERVIGLVWVDAHRVLGTSRTRAQIERFLTPFRVDFAAATRELVRGMLPPAADAALVERIATDMASAPVSVALGALDASLSYDRRIPGGLRELAAPIVAINPGDRPNDVESLRRHGVDAVLMPGVGHFPMLEDPGTFNRLLDETVERLVRATR